MKVVHLQTINNSLLNNNSHMFVTLYRVLSHNQVTFHFFKYKELYKAEMKTTLHSMLFYSFYVNYHMLFGITKIVKGYYPQYNQVEIVDNHHCNCRDS